MEQINGTHIFWFITLGLLVGWVFGITIKNEGRSLAANMTWGTVGAVLVGCFAIWLGLGDGLLFSFMGTLGVLFIANVFHQHHKEDIYGHIDFGIKISERGASEKKNRQV